MKKLLIISVLLIGLGAAVFVAVMSANDWDFSKIGTSKMQTETHTVTEDFDSILVNTDTADITFLPAEDGVCRVVCYEHIKEKHSAEVTDGRLEIKVNNEKKWYDYIGFFKSPSISVYLTSSAYKALEIDESTGNIRLPSGFTFESVDISLSTGNVHFGADVTGAVKVEGSTGNVSVTGAAIASLDVKLSTGDVHLDSLAVASNVSVKVSTGRVQAAAVDCKALTVKSTTGDVTLKDVNTAGELSVEVSTGEITLTRALAERFTLLTDTGDVKLDASDAKRINIKTDTGSVKGTLLTPKLFSATTDTGKITLPESSGSEPCVIETDTGSISISIASND